MAWVLRMPEVAANATEAVLADWLVAEAADFAVGDTLATVETEKALVDVEAETAGTVLKTLVPPSSQVEVGAPIAVLAAAGETVADLDALLRELGVTGPTPVAEPERRDVPDLPDAPAVDPGSGAPVVEPPEMPADPPQMPASQADGAASGADGAASRAGRIFSSPLARKLAKDAGIPLAEITGTGPRQRILRRDVEVARAARAAPAAAEVAPPAAPAPAAAGGTTEVPHTRLRRAIAARLTESKQSAPHFYLRATVRAERLLALRAEVNEGTDAGGGSRISVNDLVLKAVAAAHRRVPEMNAEWTDDATVLHERADVAVAVATDRGLLTPVVRDVGSLSVTAVAERVRDLAGRAREGRLRQEELEGGTISVTNLGMYGVEEFAAIINPPHAAILAVGAVREAPVVEGGGVVPGQVMTLTLSVDHRPVDGVLAARWLAVLTELLEHPVRLLA
ncbi:dihydrolipoamide acetyltransferase family protein [Nocardioides aequoreus]|uniref:dihydrolipoamide acetyltransferase family protein n=1 Tax=Nocardioides aequoreus TaxID=397278 RepID=UPI0004C3E16F|nr:dihydrolipoamide acetyltransferase family protein [Nocardioides aequoreus]